jgi:hypothetical protein
MGFSDSELPRWRFAMEALAAAAISIAGPYIAKGAEAFAQEAGKQAAGAAKALVDRLQRWWSGEPVAGAAAEHLASDPKKYSTILGDLLASELAENEAFAAELQELVDGVGPYVEVVQRIEIARGVTGADIDEVVRGRFRVEQQMKEAQDVTGFRAKKVGG